MEPVKTTNEEDLLAAEDEGWDWFAIVNAALRGKLQMLALGVLCAVLAFLYLLKVPTRFESTVEILPPQVARVSSTAAMLSQSGMGDAALLSGLSSSLQAKSQADIFVLLLQAWPIQDYLVKRFDLMSVYKASTPDTARNMVLMRTSIKSTKEGLLTISYDDTDRNRAAAIANAYVDATQDLLHSMALSESSQRRLFYEAQLAKTREDLANAENAFKDIQKKNGMIALDTQARGLVESAASLRSQVTAKEVEVESLRSYLTESNPQLQIAETELASLRAKVTQLESSGQGGYTGRSLSSVPESELAFVRATRELKYQEGLYDLMVKQYEGSRIDESRGAPIIQVVAPALVPEHKAGPRRFRDIGIAFLVGAFLGLLLTLLRYALSTMDESTRARMVQIRRSLLGWS